MSIKICNCVAMKACATVASLFIGFSAIAKPAPGFLFDISFEKTWSRYPSPPVLMEMLKASFPLESKESASFQFNDFNRYIMGDSNAATGKPVHIRPGMSFVEWYAITIADLLQSEYGALMQSTSFPPGSHRVTLNFDLVKKLLGDRIASLCNMENNGYFLESLKTCRLEEISESDLQEVVSYQLLYLVGDDDVLEYRGLGTQGQQIKDQLSDFVTMFKTSPPGTMNIGSIRNDSNILTLLAFTKYMILMKDILRF